MKNLLMLSVFLLTLIGCATPGIERVHKTLPAINEERTASVGDIFFENKEVMIQTGFFGETLAVTANFSYDLTILEANEKNIGLSYSEYTGDGLIKAGFNKRFDYPTSDKFLRFKDSEFDVISVDKGQLRYKRIK